GPLHAGAAGGHLRGESGTDALAGREAAGDSPDGPAGESRPVSLRRAASTALLLGAIPMLASAQTSPKAYLAFGDSITFGVGDDPARTSPGYPPRLQTLLVTAGVNATVANYGMSGEKTPDGLTRIDAVLANGKPGDVLILMEG